MTKIDLPSGAWVELNDPKSVSERLCRPVRRAMAHITKEGREALADAARREADGRAAGQEISVNPDLSDADIAALWDVNDHLAAAVVTSWSVDAPVSVEAIVELPRADYEAVVAAAAPFLGAIFFDEGDAGDPKAGAEVSTASSGL